MMEGRNRAADEGAGNHQGSAAIVETCEFFQEIHSEFRKDRGVDYVTDQEGCYVVLGGKAETGFPWSEENVDHDDFRSETVNRTT